MMSRFVFVLLIGLVGLRTLFVEPAYQHIPPEKLGIKTITSMCWRKDGSLWLTSDKGLVHYNGYASQVFSHRPQDATSILSNAVRSVHTDSKDHLWIFYLDRGGCSYFNPDKNQFKHFIPDSTNSKSPAPSRITGVLEDRKGRIWFTTWGSGLMQYFPETDRFKKYPVNFNSISRNASPASRIKAMIELPNGQFLVTFFEDKGKDNSLPYLFNPETETFTPYSFDEAFAKCSPAFLDKLQIALRIVNFVYLDPKQNLWFGTYSGLMHYNTTTKEFRRVSGKTFDDATLNLENTRGYTIDEKGLLWVATSNSGVMVVDPETFEARYSDFDPHVPASLADDATEAIRKDAEGNIWVATETGGLSIYSPVTQQFSLHTWETMGLDFGDASRDNLRANQLLVKSHRELQASDKDGITSYDPVTQTQIKQINPREVNVGRLKSDLELVEDFKTWDDTLVMTSYHQAIFRDWKKEHFEFVPGPRGNYYFLEFRHEPRVHRAMYGVEENPQHGNQLFEMDYAKKELVPFVTFPPGTQLSRRYSFLLKNGDWLLSGSAKAFIRLNPTTKQYTVYGYQHPDHFFPDSTILSAHLDSSENLWLCTQHGLYKYDLRSEKSEKMNAQLGLADEEVMSMITDRAGIRWLFLNNALVRWDEKNKQVFRFDRALGMMSVRFTPSVAQMDELGWIYTVCNSGVLVFNPANIVLPQKAPQLFVESVIIQNDTLNATERQNFLQGERSIAYTNNSLNIDFYSNQIYAPVPHHFYYRLDGIDTTWQDNGTSNRIRLTNLSHGAYTLEVKIRNVYGQESAPLRLNFAINKPFWLSWWFIVLCLTGTAVLVYLYIKRRERSLQEQKNKLEEKIAERTSEVVEKANEIHRQKDIIETKNKELTDSIHYAQRIQQSILPNEHELQTQLPQHFVFFRPKDIVSGDFYWQSSQEGSVLWAVVDSTGHGVPGGFMSMLGSGLLNQIVNEEHKLRPDLVLNELRDRLIAALKQTGADGESRDGMDLSFCRYLPAEQKIQFAGAFNSLYLLRAGQLTELRGDKQPIGIYHDQLHPFTLQEMTVQAGDQLYMTSDGYTDQFGGPKGKKFKSVNFEKLLIQIGSSSMDEQKARLEKTILDWMGDLEQVDDICVFGVRI